MNTPYSKMAAILVFICLISNWPFWPHSMLNILLNFMFESEAKVANLQGNKGILKWRPFWNKAYTVYCLTILIAPPPPPKHVGYCR